MQMWLGRQILEMNLWELPEGLMLLRRAVRVVQGRHWRC